MPRKPANSPRGAQRRSREVAPPVTKATGVVGRWLWRLLSVVTGLGLIATTVFAVRYLLALEVRRIAVTGALHHVVTEDIEALVAREIDAGFLLLDLDAIKLQLEQMPWVYAAEVRRHWPDTLGISVYEQRPIALWGQEGLLNHAGDYFAGEQLAFQDLPRLEGASGRGPYLMTRYLQIESAVSPLGLHITRVAEDRLGQIEVTFSRGTVLHLGSADFVPRLQRFVALWQAELMSQSVARVDMRYERGAAVRTAQPRVAVNSLETRGN